MLHLVFNPATAATDGADASPRLLQVVPPLYPLAQTDDEPAHEGMVQVEVTVGADGRVTDAATAPTEDPRLAEAATAIVRRWSFAPARREGQAVEGTVVVPVLFQPPVPLEVTAVAQPPQPISQARPVYPPSMRQAGVGAEVLVGMVINVEGRVVDAHVVASNHPAFDEAAVEAVGQWRFRPGRIGDRLVSTRLKVPIVFAIHGGSSAGFQVSRPRKWPDGLPELLRFDHPPELVNLAPPAYPREALLAGEEGKVTVAFLLGPEGRVQQATVEPGASPHLAGAARAAAEALLFKPAQREGRASPAAVRMTLEFKLNGAGDVPVTESARRLLRVLRKSPEDLVPLAELDAIPQARSRRPPALPLAARIAGRSGEARVEFIIDRKGFAQLPRVLEATDPAFGYAAMQAIATWRYEAPRRKGKPVDAIAVIPVRFDAAGS